MYLAADSLSLSTIYESTHQLGCSLWERYLTISDIQCLPVFLMYLMYLILVASLVCITSHMHSRVKHSLLSICLWQSLLSVSNSTYTRQLHHDDVRLSVWCASSQVRELVRIMKQSIPTHPEQTDNIHSPMNILPMPTHKPTSVRERARVYIGQLQLCKVWILPVPMAPKIFVTRFMY